MSLETDRDHLRKISMAPDKDQNHSAKMSMAYDRDKNHSRAISMGSDRDKNNSAIIFTGSNTDINHSKSLGGNKNNFKSLGDSMQGGRMKSQSSTGTGSSPASSGSCNFQFFVQSDDGLNLTVDLNSDPLDWMRACTDGIRVPQHLHKPKKRTLRSNSSSSSVVGAGVLNAEKGVQCNGFGSGVSNVDGSGRKRVEIDKSASGCVEERPQDMQVMPLKQPRAMGELCASQPEALQNRVLHGQKGFQGRELIANGLEHGVCGVVSEARDAGISDQGAFDACDQWSVLQQCGHAEEAFQNKYGEISSLERNFQMDIPVESTTQEMDYSMVGNLQDESQMHKDEVKKAPVAKNLRNLKNLARGPFVVQEDNRKSRRKSSRFLPKGPY